MAIRGLNTPTTFTLLAELDDAVGQARAGLRVLRHMRHNVEDFTAVLTLLAIAAEKTNKIALGLHHLDAGEAWPSRKVMQAHGHDVVGLWSEVRSIYLDRLAAGGGMPIARMAIEATDTDAVAGALLAGLGRWGREGRFFRLDQLAGHQQTAASPAEVLERIEEEVLARDTTILTRLGDPKAYEAARSQMNQIQVAAMRGWWQAHVDSWSSGLLGPDARGLSVELRRVLKD